jgi:6-phosphogluconolactonase (cycloisomerase 2 family)
MTRMLIGGYSGHKGDGSGIAVLGGELPRYVAEVLTGNWPRHLALDGNRLHLANERSHEVKVMEIDTETGIPAQAATIEVPSPTCVLP